MPHLRLTNIPKFINTDDEESALDKSGNPAFSPVDARDILNIHDTISYSGVEQAGSNVLGNTEVVFNLGSARHRCIGKKQDKKNDTILYLLWASDGTHKIMRYHRTKTSIANPYGFIEKVLEYNFGWTQRTKITGIDLVQDNDTEMLYWTDNIGPRKVNIGKASLLNKNRMWSLYVPKTEIFGVLTKASIQGVDANGNFLVGVQKFIPAGTTNEDALDLIAAEVNSTVTSITAEACDCHLKITDKTGNIVRINFLFDTGKPTLVVPENWYGVDLADRMFDQGKFPPPAQPLASFGQDPSRLDNKVRNKVWQFRLFGIYDDYETSILNPISQIPIGNVVCNPVLEKRLNYIDINFNDSSLLDPKVLTILKKVAVCSRETNEGIWKEVTRLDICDFFDIDANNNRIAHYKFYNDVVANPVPEQDVKHHHDLMPRQARALKVSKGRQVLAGMDKDCDYDKPDCVDIQLTPERAEDPTPATYEVTFRIRVLSRVLDDDDADDSPRESMPKATEVRGPIMHNKGRLNDAGESELDYPFFGGLHFGTNGSNPADTVLTSDMESRFQQNLPEGGWFCYAAGTDYGGISKQINVGLPTTKDGALIIGSGGTVLQNNVRRIGHYLNEAATPLRDLYSEVKIRVPNGRHIFRLASHWCSFGDKLQKGKMYDLNNGRLCHKTSTMVWGVKHAGGTAWSPGHEIVVSVQGADIFGGEFIVRDLSNLTNEGFTDLNPIVGYLYDANGSVDEDVLRKEGIPVHRAFLSANPTSNLTPNAAATQDRTSCFSDHNGFFYFSVNSGDDYAIRAWQVNQTNGLGNSTQIAFAQMFDLAGWPALNSREGTSIFRSPRSLQDLFEAQLQSAPEDLSNTELNQFLLATTSDIARKNCSTIVRGMFVDQNNVPIQGVLSALEGGGHDISDEDGIFSIVAWGDMIGQFTNMPENNNNRVSVLHYSLPAHCRASFIVPFFPINISALGGNIGVSGPPYSPTAIYDLMNNPFLYGTSFKVTLNQPIIYKSWKAGGDYVPGIVYFDSLLRQCSVAYNEEGKVHIPFTTETVAHGPTTLRWAINHPCPRFAAFYQLVMRRDAIHADYLTWVINDAKYIIAGESITLNDVTTFEFTESAFGNNDANMVLLDIGNITDFAEKNFDTRISYTWKKGDRVRLVRKEDGVHYSGLFDYEIISFQQPSYLVIRNKFSLSELKAGMLIQIYTPKPVTETDFFFERGETFACTAPGAANNQHSVTSGVLTGGDTYFRHRSIPVLNDDKNIATVFEYFMECSSVSDYYDSQDEDIGRVQVYDDTKRSLSRPALMRLSDNFIPNNKINGLNRFREGNQKELDLQDGMIISLKTPADTLLVTQENGIVSNYVEVTEMRNTDGSTNLIFSKEYFGTDNRLQGEYGALFADGIVQEGDSVYGVSNRKGLAWRRSNNGLFPISDYKAVSYFGKYSQRLIWDIAAVFHKERERYIVTIWEKLMREVSVRITSRIIGITVFDDEPFDVEMADEVEITYTDRLDNIEKTVSGRVTGFEIPKLAITVLFDYEEGSILAGDTVKIYYRGTADTIAFVEPDNRWAPRYSFTPEAYESIGDEIVSFKDGRLWLHDTNPLRNNFYGTQYTSRIKTIFNGSTEILEEVKLWLAMMLNVTQSDGACNWEAISITNKNGQASRILKNNLVPQIVKGEQYFHSETKRDLNTVGVTNPILNGRFLRSSALEVELESDYTGEGLLRSVSMMIEISERNTK